MLPPVVSLSIIATWFRQSIGSVRAVQQVQNVQIVNSDILPNDLNHLNCLNVLNEQKHLPGPTFQPILKSIADKIQRKHGEHEGNARIRGEMGRDEEKLAAFVQH